MVAIKMIHVQLIHSYPSNTNPPLDFRVRGGLLIFSLASDALDVQALALNFRLIRLNLLLLLLIVDFLPLELIADQSAGT
jgi:hypothetical protein